MNIFKKETNPDNTARQALIWLHPTALVTFMTTRRWVITEGNLPKDAEFHHVFYDQRRQVFGLVITSREFKELKVGQEIPELPPLSFRAWKPKDGEIE